MRLRNKISLLQALLFSREHFFVFYIGDGQGWIFLLSIGNAALGWFIKLCNLGLKCRNISFSQVLPNSGVIIHPSVFLHPNNKGAFIITEKRGHRTGHTALLARTPLVSSQDQNGDFRKIADSAKVYSSWTHEKQCWKFFRRALFWKKTGEYGHFFCKKQLTNALNSH